MQRLLEAPKPQKIDKSNQNDEPTITLKQEEIQEEKKVYPVPDIKAEEPK